MQNKNKYNSNRNQKNRNTSYYKTQARKGNRNKFSFSDTAKKRQMSSYLRAISVLFVFMIVVSGFIFLGIFLKNLVIDSEDKKENILSSGEDSTPIGTVGTGGDGATAFGVDSQPQIGPFSVDGDSLEEIDISQIYNTYNGVYLDIQKLSSVEDLDNFIAAAKEKNINAVNIDIKRKDGVIPFKVENLTAIAAKAVNVSDIEGLKITEIISKLHENNIYVSGTVVCFKDDLISAMYPSYSLTSLSTAMMWTDSEENHWLNAYSDDAKNYISEIVSESAQLGFDEIILSYFFFPNLSNPSDLNYESNGVSKYDAVQNFIGDIKDLLRESYPDIKLGIDIPLEYFLTSPHEVTGINPNNLIESGVCDFIATSFAPSEISTTTSINGVTVQNAAQKPYDSVKILCNFFKDYPQRIMFRPYLQAYDSADGVKYDTENIMAQKRALFEIDIKVWQLINFDNIY